MRCRLCVLFSLSVAFSGNTFLAALAQSSTNFEAPVADFERALFEEVHSGEPLEQRLQAVESKVFGEPKTGSLSARVDAIGKIVDPGSIRTLVPPMAPSLDSGHPAPTEAPNQERKLGRVDVSVNESPGLNDLLTEGTQKYREGRLAEAEQTFRQVLARDHNNPNALYNLGALAEHHGDLNGALGYYKQALGTNPQDEQLRAAVTEISLELSKRQAGEARTHEAEARAQAAEARARSAEARAQAAEDQARAQREFDLNAQRSRHRNPFGLTPGVPGVGTSMFRFPTMTFVGRSRFGGGFGGGGSFLGGATGFLSNAGRIGINLAAAHCAKCRRLFFGR